jgi:hypothetical protein
VPLGQAAREVAACPCAGHHANLASALAAADELILRVVASSAPLPEAGGRHVVGEGEEIQVGTAIAPNGRSFLHVFSDVEAASARYPLASFVGVAPGAAFRMALADGNEGILLSAGGDDVVVTSEGVARLRGDAPPGAADPG